MPFILQDPEGPAFRLPLDGLCPGLPVMMLGFPEAPRADVEGLSTPVAAKGHTIQHPWSYAGCIWGPRAV
ncbi:hypothetical protein WJX77_009434 [Trebouxia sp. C0004]